MLNIFFGVFSLLIAVGVFIFYGSPIGFYNSTSDNILALLITGSIIFHMLLALPCIIGGIYLRSFAEWSRGVVIVVSALNILNPPIGSMIGGYGLWVLLTPETDPLFTSPPPDHRPKKPTEAQDPKAQVQPKKAAATTIVPSPRS